MRTSKRSLLRKKAKYIQTASEYTVHVYDILESQLPEEQGILCGSLVHFEEILVTEKEQEKEE